MVCELERRVKDSKFGAWTTGILELPFTETGKTIWGTRLSADGSNHRLCMYCIRGSLSWSNKEPSKYNGSQKMCLFLFHVISLRSAEDAGGSYVLCAIQTPKFLPSCCFSITQVWSPHRELKLGHHQVLLGVHKSGTGRRGRTGHVTHAKQIFPEWINWMNEQNTVW